MIFARLSVLALVAALAAAASASSVYFAHAGQACGTPHTKCRKNLVCENKVCKVPENQACIGRESLCAKHLVCAGKKTNKKCVRPKQLGGHCGRDPFWVCASGLQCKNYKCVRATIPKGGDCLPAGSKCAHGLVCAGTKHKKTCVYPVGPGGWCAGPFAPCQSGLFCQNKICVTPKDGDCKPKGSVCAHGTVCAGNKHKRRCVWPKSEGGPCGSDPFWVCAKGLQCKNYRCEAPRVPAGGSCLKAGSVCKHGLVCKGNKHDKRCIALGGVGAACGMQFQECDGTLYCERNKCRDGRGKLGSRCTPRRPCSPGLVCSSIPLGGLRTVCAKESGQGESCGAEFVCKRGMSCKGGFCAW